MNPSARLALSLLGALLLWWPTMVASLEGSLDLTTGVVRLAVALLIMWVGIGVVGRLVTAYGATTEDESRAEDRTDDPARR